MAIFKNFFTLLLVVFGVLIFFYLTGIDGGIWDALAINCPQTDYDCQIAEIQRDIDALMPAQEHNKKELEELKKQLADIQKRIDSISLKLKDTEKDILAREEDLGVQQELLNARISHYYIRLRQFSPIIVFLTSESATDFARELVLRQQAADQDRNIILDLSAKLLSLRQDKETLEKNKSSLQNLQRQVDSRAKFLAGEVEKVGNYLASLSAKQQELLALKAGGFSTSVGETPASFVPCSGAPGSSNYCDPGFRPAFAAFSFGAPHRTGMSQYGAYGRAKLGQSATDILKAYYQGADVVSGYAEPSNITVSGYGTISFEDNYLMGIYEMPESWGESGGFEALKAQAIAARTYALYATANGSSSICATESCQVYKSTLHTGKWRDAVNQTRGMVIVRGGSPAAAYYASTAGGFTISQWGWTGIKDAKDGDWPNQAYENIAGSPWFYMAWYTTRSGATCGRSNPWLNTDEFVDILNAWVVYKSGDSSRISPVDTNCWPGNPYSVSEMKARAESLGGSYSSVTSVSVIYGNDGSTLSVSINTDRGLISIPGSDFKTVFNLRAPGYIGLKSSLFNIVKL